MGRCQQPDLYQAIKKWAFAHWSASTIAQWVKGRKDWALNAVLGGWDLFGNGIYRKSFWSENGFWRPGNPLKLEKSLDPNEGTRTSSSGAEACITRDA